MADTLKGKLDVLIADVAIVKTQGASPDVSADIVPTGAAITIPAGYHDGSKHVTADADLVTGNVKAGVNIYGTAGKAEVVDTTEAAQPIAVGTIISGKVGFVNGVKITGNNANVVDTTEAGDAAVAGNIANGKIAFVNGVKITGTAI